MRKLLVTCCLALLACGDSERESEVRRAPAPTREPSPQREPAPEREGTRLVVEVRPTEAGRVRRRVVTELPPGVTRADFAPTPPDIACAEIYGGPATARVHGVLDGKPLRAAFSRINACEMQRWDRVSALLGPVPGVRGPGP